MRAPVTLEELFAGCGADLDAMYQRVKGLMETEGVWTLFLSSANLAQRQRNSLSQTTAIPILFILRAYGPCRCDKHP